MARLRGPRATPGDRVDAALARRCSLDGCADTRPHYHRGDDELVRLPHDREAFIPGAFRVITQTSYRDALLEAEQMCRNLGLDVSPGSEASLVDVGGLVRFVYGEGWLACESRLASPDMADLIHQAINWPGTITDKRIAESDNQHRVRAVQQVVAYGVKSEPH